jgi:hypothetical protein
LTSHVFDRRPRAAPAGKKAGKTEARVHKFTAGYQKRAATLLAEGRAAAGAIAEQRLALDTYALMHAYEGVGLTARVAALQELNRMEAAAEAKLQARYAALVSARGAAAVRTA